MSSYRGIERVSESVATPIEKVSERDLGTAPIPKERYTSKTYMEREWEKLWTKVWLMGALVSDLAEPGDYVVTEVGRESILLVRDSSRQIKAFYNVCQHRGNRLCRADSGNASSFKCGYHHWEFNLDGSIKNIPDVDMFKQGAPSYGLTEIACETWAGWAWFNLNPDAEPLRDFLNVLPEHLDPYRFDEQFLYEDVSVEWACNWKTSVDAFNESYHVQAIHPEIMDFLDDINTQIDLYDKHNRYLVPLATPSPRMELGKGVPAGLRDMLVAEGMDPAPYAADPLSARRAIQLHKRKTGPDKGFDYSALNDDQLSDDYHYMIFPNITLNIYADGFMLFRQRPHPSDPDKMLFDMQLYRRPQKGETPPERPEHKIYEHGKQSLGQVVDQDAHSLPGTQAGMHSAGFKGLWIGDHERRIRHFHDTVEQYLNAE